MRADRHRARRTHCAHQSRWRVIDPLVEITPVADTGPKKTPRCPYCSSGAVATNPKRPTTSYWRCEACGQIWHPDRIPQHRGNSIYR
jgi:hypothetical protein